MTCAWGVLAHKNDGETAKGNTDLLKLERSDVVGVANQNFVVLIEKDLSSSRCIRLCVRGKAFCLLLCVCDVVLKTRKKARK